jgi:hypothetical protein
MVSGNREKESAMYVYALLDDSETMGIYSSEENALAAAQIYMAEQMWHNCRIRKRFLDSTRFDNSPVLWYEDCGKLVRYVD